MHPAPKNPQITTYKRTGSKTDNEKYVRRGQALIIRDDPQRRTEVRNANRRKAGAPFRCADSLFAALAVTKSMTGLPYRHLQGMLTMTPTGEDILDYTTIYRRFQSMDVRRDGNVFTVAGRRMRPSRLPWARRA